MSRSRWSAAWPSFPEPNPGDLFLDLEGDPYALDDGVDYLFGVLDAEGTFTAFWSFDPDRPSDVTLAGEKRAFEQLIDFVTERLERAPGACTSTTTPPTSRPR